MVNALFSDDLSDKGNFNYLIASGILPFVACTETNVRPVGSKKGKSPNVSRDYCEALHRLNCNYFGNIPKYSECQFERRIRVPRIVFNKLEKAQTGRGVFLQRTDALPNKGIHIRMRLTAALRMLAYGNAADALDEYLQMSDDTVLFSMKRFCQEFMIVFSEEYLRHLTEANMHRILCIHTACGLPGCLGGIDYPHCQ